MIEEFKAPDPIKGETYNAYMKRLAQSFEEWANSSMQHLKDEIERVDRRVKDEAMAASLSR